MDTVTWEITVIDKEYHVAKMEWRRESKEINERIGNWIAARANDQVSVRETRIIESSSSYDSYGETKCATVSLDQRAV